MTSSSNGGCTCIIDQIFQQRDREEAEFLSSLRVSLLKSEIQEQIEEMRAALELETMQKMALVKIVKSYKAKKGFEVSC